METKLSFAKGWIAFWTFIAGLLQDQGDRASSKRLTLFALLAIYCYNSLAFFHTAAADVNMQIYWGNLAALLTFGGFVVSEFFKPLSDAGLLKPMPGVPDCPSVNQPSVVNPTPQQ